MNSITLKRFDETYGCVVTFTLTERTPLYFSRGGETDEGHDITYESYRLEGDIVYLTWERSARDCDGPLNQYGDLEWSVTGETTETGTPVWITADQSQRDHYAEAAGY